MALTRRSLGVFVGIVAALILVSIPVWATQGVLFFAGVTLTAALFALSWNLLFSYAGLASFGHAAFFALGAYGVGVMLKANPTGPFLLMLFGALLLGGIVAFLVGIIALRRSSGIQLAILTMAIAEVLRIIIGYSPILGQDDGLAAIPRPVLDLLVVNVSLRSDASYFWFLCAAGAVFIAALWWVTHSRHGRVLRAIHQDPQRSSFLGIEVNRYRLIAFVLSGATAALAGGLSSPWIQFVAPEVASLVHSTQPMLHTLLGGSGTFWGPVVGAATFAAIDYATRGLTGVTEVVMGVTILLVVLLAPSGLMGAFRQLTRGLAPSGTTQQSPTPSARVEEKRT